MTYEVMKENNNRAFRKKALQAKVDSDIANYSKTLKRYDVYMKVCFLIAAASSQFLLLLPTNPHFAVLSVLGIPFMLMAFLFSRDLARICAKQQMVIQCANLIAQEDNMDISVLETYVKNYDISFGML